MSFPLPRNEGAVEGWSESHVWKALSSTDWLAVSLGILHTPLGLAGSMAALKLLSQGVAIHQPALLPRDQLPIASLAGEKKTFFLEIVL